MKELRKKLEKHKDGLKESIREGNPFKVSNLFGIIVDLIDFVLELEKNKNTEKRSDLNE